MAIAYEQARYNMVQQQIRPWQVTEERVLAVLSEIPRERFVPEAYRPLAYADLRIPLGPDAYMLEPRLIAHLLQALSLTPRDRVLEIGTGSGYGTACLARLSARVVSLEIDAQRAEQARSNLAEEPKHRWEVRAEDGLAGPVRGQPFDAIALTGSLPDEHLLPPLQEQLVPGGRLFAVLGKGPAMEAVRILRTESGTFQRRTLFETEVAPLQVDLPVEVAFSF